MAYVKENAPSKVYHLTKKENLDSILEDGRIRRFGDSECWFCTDPQKMKAYMEQTVMCEGKPYYAVGGQLCRYPKFVPEDYIILKLTPCHQKDSWYRWEQEVPAGSPAELVRAAHEFSALKIGYRGELAFQNAEGIDVPRFLTEGLTQGEPVQTNAELRDALFQRIEQEQKAYTESLYHMTQSELIANAGEIEATRYCYNALLTANLERYKMLLLLADGYPLTCVRDAWQTEQDVDRDDEFRHTVFRLCEDLQENQQDLTM